MQYHISALKADLTEKPKTAVIPPELCVAEILLLVNELGFEVKTFEKKFLNDTITLGSAEVSLRGKFVSEGFCVNKNSETAVAIAVIEAFERLIMKRPFLLSDLKPRTDGSHALEGFDLLTFKTALVQESIVFGPDTLYPVNSNGWSVHSAYCDAVMSSILELTERDIMIRNWICSRPPNKFDFPDSNIGLAELTFEFGFHFCKFIYSTPGDFKLVGSVLYNPEKNLIYIGKSCKADLREASEKSLEEAFLEFYFHFYRSLTQQPRKKQKQKHNPTHYHQAYDLFVHNKDSTSPPVEDAKLQDLLLFYNFTVLPFSIKGIDKNANLVAVKSYSPVAVPLFRSQYPKLAPKDFVETLKKSANGQYPL